MDAVESSDVADKYTRQPCEGYVAKYVILQRYPTTGRVEGSDLPGKRTTYPR